MKQVIIIIGIIVIITDIIIIIIIIIIITIITIIIIIITIFIIIILVGGEYRPWRGAGAGKSGSKLHRFHVKILRCRNLKSLPTTWQRRWSPAWSNRRGR